MFDFNTIPQSIAYAKICSNLQQRHDQWVKDLANVEKDEEIVGLKRIIIEKDEMINTLKSGLLTIEENEEFERKMQNFKFIKDTGLHEDKDGNKFCSKCIWERHQFYPVRQNDSRKPDYVDCIVCEKPYYSVIAQDKRRTKEKHDRSGRGNFCY